MKRKIVAGPNFRRGPPREPTPKEKAKTDKEAVARLFARSKWARLRTLEHALHAQKYWLSRREDEARNHRVASAMASRIRRAREMEVEGTFTESDVRELFIAQDGECICSADLTKGFHVDHVHPLSKGGSNWPSNLHPKTQI
jgi:5-methylcytosine-specific restriction endonuclease McrA